MLQTDKILEYMKGHGPVIPVNVSKFLNTTIIMASALLSDLASSNSVKISSVKVGGGSPVYYLPGHRERLQEYSKYLHEKEQKAYGVLKEQKVLRDSGLDPLTRVALREIKDFAVPLRVTVQGRTEIFWKWYLITDRDAEPYIRSFLSPPIKAVQETVSVSVPSSTQVLEKSQSVRQPVEKQEPLHPTPEKSASKKLQKPKILQKKKSVDVSKSPEMDEYLKKAHEYFSKHNIVVDSSNAVKKGKEYSFKIKIPSPVGELSYYCIYLNKKKINEKDISSVYLQGQVEKLPVLVLSSGDPSKKVIEKLQTHFKGVTIKKL